MKKISRLFFFLVMATSVFATCPEALAREPMPSAASTASAAKVAPAPAPTPLSPLAVQLGQTLQTLVGSTEPQPATAPDIGEDVPGQIADTFAVGILDTLAKTVAALKTNAATLAAKTSVLSDMNDWIALQSRDPRHAAFWTSLGQDFLIIVGVPFLIAAATTLFLLPLRRKVKNTDPQTASGKISFTIALLFMRLVPFFVFLGSALLLLNQNESHKLTRFVLLNVIYALSLSYAIIQILRSFFAPGTEALRPLSMSTPRAFSVYRWVTSFCFFIIYSYFLIDVATAVRVPATAITAFQNVFATLLTVLAMAAIFRTRSFVAAILRGNAEDDTGFIHALRIGLAQHWHVLAATYLVISLGVILTDVTYSFARLLQGTILSLGILIAMRLGFVIIEKWEAPNPNGPVLIHRSFLAFLLRLVLWAAAAVGIAVVCGVSIDKLFATAQGQRFLNAVLSIAVTLFVLTLLYEMLHGSIERHLTRRDKKTKQLVASARARTLLPMVRHSVFILFSTIAVLVCLSIVGFNIAPLLAGAGVIGVAVGFGSQTLIKDFLTGLFIVVENSIAVGDVVKIGTFSGIVEALSLRTIRLRDDDGSLHILPFSEVSKITNMTRGFAYALVTIGVAVANDPEKVMRLLHEVGASLQEDPVFKRVILEPIEVTGLEELDGAAMTFQARLRTRPGKQWDVRRLLLLRIKQCFDRENIEIPLPTTKQITATKI